MTKTFQRHVEHVKEEITYVGTLVEDSLAKATKSLFQRDRALAESINQVEEELDRHELDVDEECLTMLALYHPVAIDLRFVITILKINTDLERLYELAVNIARQALKLAASEGLPLPGELQEMANRVRSMVKRALDSLVLRDTRLARAVWAEDDEVDHLRRKLYIKLPELIRDHPEHVEWWLRVGGVGRSLERIGDMATNIAEEVVYMVEGEIVRHRLAR